MEESENDLSSNSEKEKTNEKIIKNSDIKKYDNKIFNNLYCSGSIEEEEKEKKNNIDINNNNKIEEEKNKSENRPSKVEKNLMESVLKMDNITKEYLHIFYYHILL